MEIPEGWAALLWDRSSMAYKKGIVKLAGVIDSDYRGEVGVVFLNTTDNDFYIGHGEKIVQMIITKVPQFEFEEVIEITQTGRGEGGFGSTGST
jgi:dUTP pyrophosphatase